MVRPVSEFNSLYQLMAKKSNLDSFTARVMLEVDEVIGGGYEPSQFSIEVAELAQHHLHDAVKNAARDEILRIRREIRKEFEGVRAERDRLKAEIEFYRGIEAAAKKNIRLNPA